jgi:hypothetical protein
MSSASNFVQQQGFPKAEPSSCGLQLSALMFQPRLIGVLMAIGPAPAPRRFAQGIAATFMLGIGLSLLGGHATLAWTLEWLLAVALAALVFGRFCLGSYLFHLFTGNRLFANATLPWRRS